MRIYSASSWRNMLYPGIVHALKRCGHDVYDFRNPPNGLPFSWREVFKSSEVTPEEYREGLQHPRAKAGYRSDAGAIETCDACVLIMPAGRSASWELGYAMGLGKKCYVILFEPIEPELMFREATIIVSMPEFFDAFGDPDTGKPKATPVGGF